MSEKDRKDIAQAAGALVESVAESDETKGQLALLALAEISLCDLNRMADALVMIANALRAKQPMATEAPTVILAS